MGPYIIYPDEVNRNRWIEKLNIAAENRLTIVTPVKEVLITGALIFLCQLLLLTFSNLYTCFFTIPLLFFWVIPYVWFCKIWTAFRFSRAYLIAAPLLIALASICLRYKLSLL